MMQAGESRIEKEWSGIAIQGRARKSIHQRRTLTGITRPFDRQPEACEDGEDGGKEGVGDGEQGLSITRMEGVITLI